jgi:hypothetical protein
MHNGLSREQVEMGSIVFGNLDRAIDVPMINPMWSNVKSSGNRGQGFPKVVLLSNTTFGKPYPHLSYKTPPFTAFLFQLGSNSHLCQATPIFYATITCRDHFLSSFFFDGE